MRKITSMLVAITLSSCSVANENFIHVPEGESQRMTAENRSMTTETLLTAYMNTNVEQRRLAEMYVIGVLDSTEGESWCGFKIASPDAIQEQVYIALKKGIKKSPKKRASIVITSHLTELLPCKDTQ
ncbi:Rap1a/Tai family immunity protein [Cellvibrio mixtus]|nr:Rap1a/Tai family immunity protein [Cellvibrio mixtus]